MSGSSLPHHADCDCERPVRPGGDFPDDWTPAHIDYAPPEDAEPAESFEDHALDCMEFAASKTFDATCMECGFEWPIHVHEDRNDQTLEEWDRRDCPHCGSEATVAQETAACTTETDRSGKVNDGE
jgi:ssDNA-binding Zn-finger/Zn-ribbon topoisomerase 1